MVSMLKTTLFQSTAAAAGMMPSRAIRPPCAMLSIMSLSAFGLPDISRPTSKPSFMPSCACTSGRRSFETSTTRVAPILAASSRRAGFTSVTTTFLAPQCFAIAAAMHPMGPAPVTSTSSPTRSNCRVVCVALPRGSKQDRTSSGIAGSTGTAFDAGMQRYSAKAPGLFTPTPFVSLHRCLRPARQLRQTPQTMWPSPSTKSPFWNLWTAEPTSSMVPTNSWPITIGVLIVFCAQSSQL